MMDVIIDTIIDMVKTLPFLFVTYVILEYLEHKTDEHTAQMVKNSGKYGPVVGGVLGIIPQCGFSIAAANFYAARVISLGTLLAVFLATSDEMLPILISERMPLLEIVKILGWKVVIGVAAGLLVDLVLWKWSRRSSSPMNIEKLCQQEHCHCETGILKPAIHHTLRTAVFLLIITLGLNGIIAGVGKDALSGLILNKPLIGPVLSGLVGLIPNCGSSIIITQLYVSRAMTFGSMMAGLLVNGGLGLLVLYRMNRNVKENLYITALLYAVGVIAGILMDACFGLV